MSKWPLVPLGKVLTKSEDWVTLEPEKQYNEVTIRLWGKGVVLRRRVIGAEIASDRRLRVRANQFILSRIDARNGAIGLVPESLEGAVVSTDFPTFALNTERVFFPYLGWMSRTPAFVDICKQASEGTTNRVRLQEDRFLQKEISLPPLPEQRRIVARIESLSAKIEEAKGFRQQTVEETDALFEQGRAKVFEKANGQGYVPLENVALLERGKFSHRPRNDSRFFGGSHPWIQIAEIESSAKYISKWSETLNDDGLAISKKFPKGTVLVSIAATIGAVGVLDFDCCIPDSIVGVTPREDTDCEFLYHFLGYVRTHLESIAPQSAQKNINLQILAPLPVPKLAIQEQRRIVAYLDSLQAKVGALKKLQAETAAELSALLPSILDKAFKGEL